MRRDVYLDPLRYGLLDILTIRQNPHSYSSCTVRSLFCAYDGRTVDVGNRYFFIIFRWNSNRNTRIHEYAIGERQKETDWSEKNRPIHQRRMIRFLCSRTFFFLSVHTSSEPQTVLRVTRVTFPRENRTPCDQLPGTGIVRGRTCTCYESCNYYQRVLLAHAREKR